MSEQNQNSSETYPVALTIAGSDSGGGAGIQADLRTFSAYGVFGTSVITAVTAQNPCEVRNIQEISPDMVREQLEAVFAKFAVKAVKTGMLVNREIIETVADVLKDKEVSLVVDPVMVSTSGVRLLQDDAEQALCEKLLPLADWVTPNIPEAERILGITIHSYKEMKKAAVAFGDRHGVSCVLKGGHVKRKTDKAQDAVYKKGNIFALSSPMIELDGEISAFLTHGTGCTFSAALAAGFAIELPWRDALSSAKAFVFGSLLESVRSGPDITSMYPPAGSYRDKVKFQ